MDFDELKAKFDALDRKMQMLVVFVVFVGGGMVLNAMFG